MNNLVLGVLAHVDSGKTTMSEALLYKSGRIKSLGRVDHKDAYLDNFIIERERGITVFSKQAVFDYKDLRINLLDTPGHADFSSEMERTLSVLDYALLIISGPDGIQAHTQTLWQLLRRYHLPVFVFVNKMDISEKSREDILLELNAHFGEGFVDFNNIDYEKIAELSEDALEEYLAGGKVSDERISNLIKKRKLCPCYFGSALKLSGVDEFLDGFARYAKAPLASGSEVGARVFKITHAEDGRRLSWIKMTSGTLHPKDVVGEEKIDQIRRYSGIKYEAAAETETGGIYALCGLNDTFAGSGIGVEKESISPLLESVLSYEIILKDGTEPFVAMQKLSQLAEEDPMLRIEWDSSLRQISARFMGEVQIDVLKEVIKDRFGFDVEIGQGRISYKESIAEPVTGAGHFEPLRHYAEVHLLLEPLEAGTGLVFTSLCKTDDLDLNWQRLILTNLMEREPVGVLTGSPLTDVRVSLIAGRAHLKHT
ncbi:MAG: GTP-binding protein, partial [Firmicutes bacterium]|nr:GTP-binding protein [Bacillota bacterium]